jgi:phosphodiesterase/alkaline phosphatase D-like protein
MLPASRFAIIVLALTTLTLLAFSFACGSDEPIEFTHGVASGDVTAESAVLWTRANRGADLTLEVSTSEAFDEIAVEQDVEASGDADYTARAGVSGLEPSTQYYFRFTSGDEASMTGAFRTAPAGDQPESVSFVFSGDSDGTVGDDGTRQYDFNVLNQARQENADFFIYLGDTILAGSTAGEPASTLEAYRDKYKENREVQPLVDFLASTSTYAMWGDGEVATGLAGTTVDPQMLAEGRQAFREYLPLNDGDSPDVMYRRFRWGSLVELIILDERSYRDASAAESCLINGEPDLLPGLGLSGVPAAYQNFREELGLPRATDAECQAALVDPNRSILGDEQKQFLFQALQESDATFKFIVNEVAMSELLFLPYDRWEGYRAERDEILRFIDENNLTGVIFLTTDFRGDVIGTPRRLLSLNPVAVEAITGPIGAETVGQAIARTQGQELADAFTLFLREILEVQCAELDAYSYGLVEVSVFGTKITLKDETGAELCTTAFPP